MEEHEGLKYYSTYFKPRPNDAVSSGTSLGLVLLGKDITKTEKENGSI